MTRSTRLAALVLTAFIGCASEENAATDMPTPAESDQIINANPTTPSVGDPTTPSFGDPTKTTTDPVEPKADMPIEAPAPSEVEKPADSTTPAVVPDPADPTPEVKDAPAEKKDAEVPK